MNPERYPALQKPFCEFEVILAKDYSHSVWLMPLRNNCVAWMINARTFAPPTSHKRDAGDNPPEENFIFPEWGPEAAEELCSKVREFASPYHDGTIGDLISHTPKDLISKVMLEDKMFETWHSDRVVLLGDACHKVVPFGKRGSPNLPSPYYQAVMQDSDGGQGATQAILDAVALVDLLHTLPSTAAKDIARVFQQYREKRYSAAHAAVTASRQGGAIFSSKTGEL
ncbi:hypothetical protein EDD11_000369 [Mortierella claussenii]|nr:hypothetical protein EDD11_000369 [Mortierella claussenii]